MKRTGFARRLLAGVSASAAVVVLLLLAASVFGADYLHSTYKGDFDLGGMFNAAAGNNLIKNWDCGCDPLSERVSFEDVNADITTTSDRSRRRQLRRKLRSYPTRCLKENHSTNLEKFRQTDAGSNPNVGWRPINNYGVRWAAHKFPEGFPDATSFPRPGTYPYIPFPGWPKRVIPKNSSDPRLQRVAWGSTEVTRYRKAYVEEEDGNGTAPGELAGNNPGNGTEKWEGYQIHHMMERRHGGQNLNGNLVPIWTWSDKYQALYNEHQDYTSWWGAVTLDGNILKLRSKATKKLRGRLQKCVQ